MDRGTLTLAIRYGGAHGSSATRIPGPGAEGAPAISGEPAELDTGAVLAKESAIPAAAGDEFWIMERDPRDTRDDARSPAGDIPG